MTPISRNEGVSGSSPLIGFPSQRQIPATDHGENDHHATTTPLLAPGNRFWRALQPADLAALKHSLRTREMAARKEQEAHRSQLEIIGLDADERLLMEALLRAAERTEYDAEILLGTIVDDERTRKHRWITTTLCAAACMLIVALAIWPTIADGSPRAAGAASPTLTAAPSSVDRAKPRPPSRWVRSTLSHYATCTYVSIAQGCDGYLGKRTACGKIVRRSSWFVAALKPGLARCGMRLTLLYRGKHYRVTVQDRGAYRSDDRALDAAPRLYRSMGRPDLARIHYRKGWH